MVWIQARIEWWPKEDGMKFCSLYMVEEYMTVFLNVIGLYNLLKVKSSYWFKSWSLILFGQIYSDFYNILHSYMEVSRSSPLTKYDSASYYSYYILKYTCTVVSKLATNDSNIIVIPKVSTNQPPCVVHTNLNSSTVWSRTTCQSDATICTWCCEK